MKDYWINISNRIKQSERLRFNFLMSRNEELDVRLIALENEELDVRLRALEDKAGYTVVISEINNVTGATVKIGSTTCTDNEDGTYTAENITPDTYTLTVEKSDYETYSAEIQVDYQHLSFEFELIQSEHTVSGTVTDDSAEPVALENVVVNILDDAAVIGTSTTDSAGAYSIDGIKSGIYTIEAVLDGYTYSAESITVNADDLTKDIVMTQNEE